MAENDFVIPEHKLKAFYDWATSEVLRLEAEQDPDYLGNLKGNNDVEEKAS